MSFEVLQRTEQKYNELFKNCTDDLLSIAKEQQPDDWDCTFGTWNIKGCNHSYLETWGNSIAAVIAMNHATFVCIQEVDPDVNTTSFDGVTNKLNEITVNKWTVSLKACCKQGKKGKEPYEQIAFLYNQLWQAETNQNEIQKKSDNKIYFLDFKFNSSEEFQIIGCHVRNKSDVQKQDLDFIRNNISTTRKQTVVLGDFNSDASKLSSSDQLKTGEVMNICVTNTQPTMTTTKSNNDNIVLFRKEGSFIKDYLSKCSNNILCRVMSDHYPVFTTFYNKVKYGSEQRTIIEQCARYCQDVNIDRIICPVMGDVYHTVVKYLRLIDLRDTENSDVQLTNFESHCRMEHDPILSAFRSQQLKDFTWLTYFGRIDKTLLEYQNTKVSLSKYKEYKSVYSQKKHTMKIVVYSKDGFSNIICSLGSQLKLFVGHTSNSEIDCVAKILGVEAQSLVKKKE